MKRASITDEALERMAKVDPLAEELLAHRRADPSGDEARRAVLERVSRYLPEGVVWCRGDKCREPWCASCFGEEEAEQFMEVVKADRSALRALMEDRT